MLLRWISGAAVQDAGVAWYLDEWDGGTGQPGWLGAPVGSRPINSAGVYTPPNAAASTAYTTYGIITIIYQNGVAYLFPAGTNDTPTGTTQTLPTAALQNGGGTQITYNLTPSGSLPPGVVSA